MLENKDKRILPERASDFSAGKQFQKINAFLKMKTEIILLLFILLTTTETTLTAQNTPPSCKYEFDNALIYLRSGSIHLNWDEWPLLTEVNYQLTSNGKKISEYSCKEYTVKKTADELTIISKDAAGLRERELSFSRNCFKIAFRLDLQEAVKGKGQFIYNLAISPDFFCDMNNKPALTVTVQDGKTYKFTFPEKDDGKLPVQTVNNWQNLLLTWHDGAKEQKMKITLNSINGTAQGMFMDYRPKGKFMLSISVPEIPETGVISFELRIDLKNGENSDGN